MTDTEVIVPETVQSQELTGRRGLDVEKVEMIMGREQDRDLTFLFRVDQLKLFDPNAKTYHRKAKSGDPVTIQLLFEMRDMYSACKEANDPKTVAALLEPIGEAIAKAEDAGDKFMVEKLSKQMDEMIARFRAAGDPKLAHSLLKQMDDIAARAEARRDKALERLFAWKKQAEDSGKGMDGMTQAELEKMANG